MEVMAYETCIPILVYAQLAVFLPEWISSLFTHCCSLVVGPMVVLEGTADHGSWGGTSPTESARFTSPFLLHISLEIILTFHCRFNHSN
jgi:hypothetical protein